MQQIENMRFKSPKFLAAATLLFLFVIFALLETLMVIYLINDSENREEKQELYEVTKRVQEDIRYKNGLWDTTLYNADTEISDNDQLYIISSDGFIIERSNPIRGLLDTSEFTRLLSYDEPQTITTITNENWRVLSKAIENNKRVLGVIMVSIYNPDQNTLEQIDELLRTTIQQLEKNISIKDNAISADEIDSRTLPYNISFQVVNRFNKVLMQNGNHSSISRPPSFIDPSYIDNQLKGEREAEIRDVVSERKYVTLTTPIYDEHKSIVGIIVVGERINKLYNHFFDNLQILILFSLFLLAVTIGTLFVFVKIFSRIIIKEARDKKHYKIHGSISFNKEKSRLVLGKHIVEVPYASYQYYFCVVLFSKPGKRWESDEIMEKIGDHISSKNWRKMYDTMNALNKKTGEFLPEKLFIVQDKTFRINPNFASKII